MNRLPRLSVVVVFHNMQREAERTLFSLTTAYQRHLCKKDYEIVAIDSSSTQPLGRQYVTRFGENFRYMAINSSTPSPVEALNAGIEAARGEIITTVIDGARILSPGVLQKTMDAFLQFERPFVYTLGMHLGSQMQQISVAHGYNQAIEDELLSSVNWRSNGYRLFSISSLAMSSKQGYTSQLTESNCTTLRRSDWSRLGGYDQRFVAPGGGLTNHDFFNRAMADRQLQPVMLLGEATFHQVHGGVSTNVVLDKNPWECFANEYRAIRGCDYHSIYRTPVYFGDMVAEASHLLS